NGAVLAGRATDRDGVSEPVGHVLQGRVLAKVHDGAVLQRQVPSVSRRGAPPYLGVKVASRGRVGFEDPVLEVGARRRAIGTPVDPGEVDASTRGQYQVHPIVLVGDALVIA